MTSSEGVLRLVDIYVKNLVTYSRWFEADWSKAMYSQPPVSREQKRFLVSRCWRYRGKIREFRQEIGYLVMREISNAQHDRAA